MKNGSEIRIAQDELVAFAAALFEAEGLPRPAATLVAQALVEADMQGQPSHGVMLIALYVERIRAGSVSLRMRGSIASDRGCAVVLDAEHALGQLTAQQAIEILLERVPEHGIAAVAVRNAFHFGTAGRWARMLAARGYVGVAMSNTRPLMPAHGGAERVVGNNPIAIAMPSEQGPPVVLDMATSASALGKIRLAEAAGEPIPEGWATDAAGRPTTDPAQAIKGMLLPAAGPKGAGLAFMIDLFCGGLSSGAIGEEVKPLYGDASDQYGCAHFFLGIDVRRFCDPAQFRARTSRYAGRVRRSRPAPGVDRVYAPGEREWSVQQENGSTCPLSPDVARRLREVAQRLGVATPAALAER